MANFEDLIIRDTRGNQPAAGTGGRLYFVTDEGVTERDSGIAWESYSTATSLSGYVPNSLFDAQSVLAATLDDTPAVLTIGEATILGRQSGGNISAINQVVSGEIVAGTETALRAYSPADVKLMAETHGGGGGTGHTITYSGTPLTNRTNLNFSGEGVVVTDNPGTDSTDVTITGGGAGTSSIVEISNETLGGTGSFTEVSIPSGYDEIWVRMPRVRTADAGATDLVFLRVGNTSLDTGANYAYQVRAEGFSASNTHSITATSLFLGIVPGDGATENYFGSAEARIYEPDGTTYWKSVQLSSANPDNAGYRETSGGGQWKSTSAIDVLNVFGSATATFIAGSQLIVLGVNYG